jgi:hypothetical protein
MALDSYHLHQELDRIRRVKCVFQSIIRDEGSLSDPSSLCSDREIMKGSSSSFVFPLCPETHLLILFERWQHTRIAIENRMVNKGEQKDEIETHLSSSVRSRVHFGKEPFGKPMIDRL